MRWRIADCGLRVRNGSVVVGAALALLLLPQGAAAQVGHAPESSPYRELRAKQAASVIVGQVLGSRGVANVGPSDGQLVGIRYDRQVGTAVDILVGLSYGQFQRFRVDPTLPLATRMSGPDPEGIAMMEAGLSLVLTGRKSWRGLVSYVGGGLGVAFDTQLDTDASGYTFGTKGLLAPHVGLKWYPVQAFSVKVEGRGTLWRLTYPTQFFQAPVGYTVPPILRAATDPSAEWTVHPTLILSAGYTFTF